MKKAIFFDRDGVLNKTKIIKGLPISPKKLSELKINNYATKLVRNAKLKKYLTIVVTNQPDVSRKKMKKKNAIKINNFIKTKLNLDDLFVCYLKNDKNFRRKPNPGMLLEAKKKWGINFKKSYLIGDRAKDISAGIKVGVKTIFLDNSYKEKKN